MNNTILKSENVSDPQNLPNGSMIRYRFKQIEILIKTNRFVWTPTRFTLGICENMLNLDLEGKTVLDYASGSGILGILALKLGASDVAFTDINEEAIKMTKINLKLNGYNPDDYLVLKSDRFNELKTKKKKYDLIVSNPPTAPDINGKKRKKATEWNQNGPDGRLVTDALITKGKKYLNDNGEILFVTTSKQGINKTTRLLNKYFGPGGQNAANKNKWEVILRENLVLDRWYMPFLQHFRTNAEKNNEPDPFIINNNGEIEQVLYFILTK